MSGGPWPDVDNSFTEGFDRRGLAPSRVLEWSQLQNPERRPRILRSHFERFLEIRAFKDVEASDLHDRLFDWPIGQQHFAIANPYRLGVADRAENVPLEPPTARASISVQQASTATGIAALWSASSSTLESRYAKSMYFIARSSALDGVFEQVDGRVRSNSSQPPTERLNEKTRLPGAQTRIEPILRVFRG